MTNKMPPIEVAIDEVLKLCGPAANLKVTKVTKVNGGKDEFHAEYLASLQ